MPLPLPAWSGIFIVPEQAAGRSRLPSSAKFLESANTARCSVDEEDDLSDAFNSAHVHGDSGTFVVSALSPYDHQLLREHLEILTRRGAAVTVGMHGTRWTVTNHPAVDSRCGTCTEFLGRLSCRRDGGAATTCIDCALRTVNNDSTERHDA